MRKSLALSLLSLFPLLSSSAALAAPRPKCAVQEKDEKGVAKGATGTWTNCWADEVFVLDGKEAGVGCFVDATKMPPAADAKNCVLGDSAPRPTPSTGRAPRRRRLKAIEKVRASGVNEQYDQVVVFTADFGQADNANWDDAGPLFYRTVNAMAMKGGERGREHRSRSGAAGSGQAVRRRDQRRQPEGRWQHPLDRQLRRLRPQRLHLRLGHVQLLRCPGSGDGQPVRPVPEGPQRDGAAARDRAARHRAHHPAAPRRQRRDRTGRQEHAAHLRHERRHHEGDGPGAGDQHLERAAEPAGVRAGWQHLAGQRQRHLRHRPAARLPGRVGAVRGRPGGAFPPDRPVRDGLHPRWRGGQRPVVHGGERRPVLPAPGGQLQRHRWAVHGHQEQRHLAARFQRRRPRTSTSTTS